MNRVMVFLRKKEKVGIGEKGRLGKEGLESEMRENMW